MQKEILAAYSGLTVTALMVFILGFSILYKCHKDDNYGSTFWMSVAVTMTWGSEFILRIWWTIWKNAYLSRQPVSWMMDHYIVFWSVIMMIISGLLFIKTLTDQDGSPNPQLWKSCAWVVLCVILMSWVMR